MIRFRHRSNRVDAGPLELPFELLLEGVVGFIPTTDCRGDASGTECIQYGTTTSRIFERAQLAASAEPRPEGHAEVLSQRLLERRCRDHGGKEENWTMERYKDERAPLMAEKAALGDRIKPLTEELKQVNAILGTP